MRVSGRCHCEKVEYGAEVDPQSAQICHCLDCQTLTGSAFRVAIPAVIDSFNLKRGVPKIYHKVADSGSRRGHAFCGDCGAPVFRLPTDNTPHYSLRVGGLDQRGQLSPPKRQIWNERRLTWVTDIQNIPEVQVRAGK